MRDTENRGSSAPAWLCLLAGYLWASAHTPAASSGETAARDVAVRETCLARSADSAQTAPSPIDPHARVEAELRRMSPRELRQLPGIGQARALAIARERWRSRSSPAIASLELVPGIGPETARQARDWLEKRGAPP